MTGVARATVEAEPRARLVFTAGERQWAVDVPLTSGSVDAAMIAAGAAVKLLARRMRPDWAAEVGHGRLTRRRAPVPPAGR